ncbi:carbohydrate kinase [Streptomyces sp. Je 1-4]|uniref:carbohydrate kinase family protein n=1 Tax=Streptomyces TaxID=1883 RepID=UPI0021D87EDC|nr:MULTISPECIES: carbohydrate kinase [unclassified Streptomyces]UYB43045.1 carbohydrate kinase [Streptomyces sp. Je 1-4]UZQ39396.1 carbohydrate kinase [Streptomyces sp. Je 1-4] [Streptomyces sp. Je 1-4 4N24]UZQ46813.1 carbohydrate kinase [Streptomyces sp. Je 1-4] [Streptomyces sp. Je 1-4 4N24_ara]
MIVVAGEALIDLVPSPQNPLPAAHDGSPSAAPDGPLPALLPRRGGGPYNTAVALGRLGSPAAFCSRISTDAFGQALLDGLHGGGVDTSLVQRGSEPTTLAVADISPDGSAGYGFYADGTADRLFTLPPVLPAAARALSLGTCSLVLEPGASAYESLLRREARRGVFTALDPNIRPGLIPDPDAYRARFRSWLPDIALLKLSEEDALWLAGSGEGPGGAMGGGRDAVLAAAKEWLAAGPAAIVLTHGGDGLTVLTPGGGALTVPGEPVTVVDTIGAGDTVNAALLHRLDAHDALSRTAVAALGTEDWQDILRFAARAAAVTCSRAGAEPPFAAELAA